MKTIYIKSIYVTMQQLADITKKSIKTGNFNRVEKCLRIADTLFKTGNAIDKNAVANVFIYSVSRVLDSSKEIKNRVLKMFPPALKLEYIHQINASGC